MEDTNIVRKRTKLFSSGVMVVVNPNPGRVYAPARGGRIVEFKPMEEYEMPADEATWFLAKAEAAYSNSAVDARDAQNEYLAMVGSDNPIKKARAMQLLGPDGNLLAQAWKRRPLVDIESEAGRADYEAALKEMEFAAKNPAPAVDVALPGPRDVKVEEPKETWNIERLRRYLKDANMDYHPAEKEPKLYAKCKQAFDFKIRILQGAGMNPVLV